MHRQRLLLILGVGLVLLGGVGAASVGLVRHEPEFFRRWDLPPGRDRAKRSNEFQSQLAHLVNEIINSREWSGQFTDEQINSYFAEDFLRSGTGAKLLPEGVSDPRVAVDADQIRLAFRYATLLGSTVISIRLRAWMAPKEPNVVALEVRGLHAGALPVSAQMLLDRMSEAARRLNIDVTWYRHHGNPVAVLRFQADQPNPKVQLKQVQLRPGLLVIHGRSVEPARGPRHGDDNVVLPAAP
jgi:hypothetical protein